MLYGYSYDEKWCRWCGCRYIATKPLNRDGFCSKACKQAHYRAYKKYVTAKADIRAAAAGKRVTQK